MSSSGPMSVSSEELNVAAVSSDLSSSHLQAPTPVTVVNSFGEWPTEASYYELIIKIGQGAFATVWKARKHSPTQHYVQTTTDNNNNNNNNNNNSNDSNNNCFSGTLMTSTDNTNITSTCNKVNTDGSLAEESKTSSTESSHCYCGVKVLNLDHVDTNLSEIRLEVQAMRLLSHSNVLECHTAFVVDRNLWLITPLMRKGSSLHCLQVARRALFQQQLQKLSSVRGAGVGSVVLHTTSMEPYIFYIVHETLLGLQYIHENGQIHRDIKAGNILIDDNGIVKIADFGVSGWLVQGGSRVEKAKTFVGTPCWMAPEVMEQVNGYDTKADVWSLGITALELARGYAPYAKFPPMKVLILTIQEDPPSLDSYDTAEDIYDGTDRSIQYAAQESYSTDMFKSFVASCLQKNPLKRPNCQELLNSKFFARYYSSTIATNSNVSHIRNPINSGESSTSTATTSPVTYREQQRDAWIANVCSLVPEVGSTQQQQWQQHQQEKQNPRKMPGNTPISILLSTSDDKINNRPAGTTWIFADGSSSSSSQVLQSSVSSTISLHSPQSSHLHQQQYDICSPSTPADDVFAALDEFEKQTGGEHYSNVTSNKATTAFSKSATCVGVAATASASKSSYNNEHEGTNNYNDDENDRTVRTRTSVHEQVGIGASSTSSNCSSSNIQMAKQQSLAASSARTSAIDENLLDKSSVIQKQQDDLDQQKEYQQEMQFLQQQQQQVIDSTTEEDDIDDFMNEFEQTTAGEDFRRSSQKNDVGSSYEQL